METAFAAAGGDKDLLLQFKAIRANRATLRHVRCVHGGGIACALALCNVDPVFLIAARSAAVANSKGYDHVLRACLPTDAHLLLRHKLVLAMSTPRSAIKIKRNHTSRDMLISNLIEAASAQSAFAHRNKFETHGGYQALVAEPGSVTTPLMPVVDAEPAMLLISDK